MADLIVLGIVFLVTAAAAVHLIQEKKKGVKCFGCPMAATCSKKNNKCQS